MAQVYEWARSIACYLVFVTVLSNLLAGSRYERYIRFFAGMVLILLAAGPLARGLDLEGRLDYLFEARTFKSQAGEFEERLWGMEEVREERVLAAYEEAVEEDLRRFAQEEGYEAAAVRAKIQTDRESPDYGQVTGITMLLSKEGGAEREGRIRVEAVTLGEEAMPAQAGGEAAHGQQLKGFAGKVAGFYGLEGADVQIGWQDD